jgi:hypothetical protein
LNDFMVRGKNCNYGTQSTNVIRYSFLENWS